MKCDFCARELPCKKLADVLPSVRVEKRTDGYIEVITDSMICDECTQGLKAMQEGGIVEA